MVCVSASCAHFSVSAAETHSTHRQTDLGDEGTLVSLPHRQPHQGIAQLFDLLVVVQPFDLSLQITWEIDRAPHSEDEKCFLWKSAVTQSVCSYLVSVTQQ